MKNIKHHSKKMQQNVRALQTLWIDVAHKWINSDFFSKREPTFLRNQWLLLAFLSSGNQSSFLCTVKTKKFFNCWVLFLATQIWLAESAKKRISIWLVLINKSKFFQNNRLNFSHSPFNKIAVVQHQSKKTVLVFVFYIRKFRNWKSQKLLDFLWKSDLFLSSTSGCIRSNRCISTSIWINDLVFMCKRIQYP